MFKIKATTIRISIPQYITRGRRTGLYEITKMKWLKNNRYKNDYGEDGQIQATDKGDKDI